MEIFAKFFIAIDNLIGWLIEMKVSKAKKKQNEWILLEVERR